MSVAATSGGTCCRRPARPGLGRRSLRALPWCVPGVVLALIPKCPACFAAYFALATGIGLSAAAASYVRGGIVTLGAGCLVYLLLRLVRSRTRTRDVRGG